MTEQLNCGGVYVSSMVMCGCVTVNETEAVMTVGQCPYGCGYLNTAEDKYSNDLDLCKRFNRHGSLCSSCSAGYYPRLHSYDLHCVACWRNSPLFVEVLCVCTSSTFNLLLCNCLLQIEYLHIFFPWVHLCQILCSPMFS